MKALFQALRKMCFENAETKHKYIRYVHIAANGFRLDRNGFAVYVCVVFICMYVYLNWCNLIENNVTGEFVVIVTCERAKWFLFPFSIAISFRF